MNNWDADVYFVGACPVAVGLLVVDGDFVLFEEGFIHLYSMASIHSKEISGLAHQEAQNNHQGRNYYQETRALARCCNHIHEEHARRKPLLCQAYNSMLRELISRDHGRCRNSRFHRSPVYVYSVITSSHLAFGMQVVGDHLDIRVEVSIPPQIQLPACASIC